MLRNPYTANMLTRYQAPAASFSAINALETCPRRYYLTRVARTIREPESEEIRWGNYVHKALEQRIVSQTPLPTTLTGYSGLVDKFAALPGAFAERKFTVNGKLAPVEWRSQDAWLRGIVDVGAVLGKTLILGDWKTGKRKPGSLQLTMSAGLALRAFPEVQVVKTAFIWLQEKKIDSATYRREDEKEIWKEVAPRVIRFRVAHEKGEWEPRPSGLCKKWCPVTRAHCEYAGR